MTSAARPEVPLHATGLSSSSYEGLRLAQPVTTIASVPSAALRASAPAVLQSFLNYFPLPNGAAQANQLGAYAASYD